MKANGADVKRYEEQISHSGLRLTPQRREVFDVLLKKRDHPTATEVFMRVKKQMPSISLATVYNCLETLVACNLVRQVNVEREPTRYCPNVKEHGHFICNHCNSIFDVDFADSSTAEMTAKGWKLPEGFEVTSQEVTLRGLCSKCNSSTMTTLT